MSRSASAPILALVSEPSPASSGAGSIEQGASGARARNLLPAAFILCVLAELVPIWAVPWFPTLDGPVHLYITSIYEQMMAGGTDHLRSVFELNRYLEPNYAVYGLLVVLDHVVAPLTAEKIFVSLHLILFGFSSWHLMRGFGERTAALGLLLIPLSSGYFLHSGFYNFSFSQTLFLLGCGYALRHLAAWSARSLATLSLLMLAMTLTHVMGIVMFLFFLGLARLGVALRDLATRQAETIRPVVTAFAKDAVGISIAAIPSLVILGSFALRRVINDDGNVEAIGLMGKIFYVASVSPIFAVDRREMVAMIPYMACFWLVMLAAVVGFARSRERFVGSLPVLLPPLALILLFTAGSLGFAGFNALPRLLPFLFFMMIIALGAVPLHRAWRGAVTVAVIVGLLGVGILRLQFYRQMNGLYDAFARTSSVLQPQAVVIAIDVTDKQRVIAGLSTGWRVNFTTHFRERFAREHGLIMLNTELLTPQIFGYFPVYYRPSLVLNAARAGYHDVDYSMLFDHFTQRTGIPIGEASFWPRPLLDPARPAVPLSRGQREFFAELREGWRPVVSHDPMAPVAYLPNELTGQRP